VSSALPVLAGRLLIKALEREGWTVVRKRGSHARLKHPDRAIPLTVPLHRELKRGTLAGILRDAGLDAARLRELL
jgi:predicted RNA binding protein YcfA (HicA-like mRNA interferase family)